jgi:hypothetical protein
MGPSTQLNSRPIRAAHWFRFWRIDRDGAQTEFAGESFIGGITPLSRVFVGPGATIDEPGSNVPVRVGISDAYYGEFFADTLNVTDRLALTASGRFNAAEITSMTRTAAISPEITTIPTSIPQRA